MNTFKEACWAQERTSRDPTVCPSIPLLWTFCRRFGQLLSEKQVKPFHFTVLPSSLLLSVSPMCDCPCLPHVFSMSEPEQWHSRGFHILAWSVVLFCKELYFRCPVKNFTELDQLVKKKCIALFCTEHHCTVLSWTVLNCAVLKCTALYHLHNCLLNYTKMHLPTLP